MKVVIFATLMLVVSGEKVVNEEFDKVLNAAMKQYGKTIDPYNVSGEPLSRQSLD